MRSVHKLRAIVCNGRLIVNEPTELPEGMVIELEQVDPYAYLDHTDDMDESERAQLAQALHKAWTDYQVDGKAYSVEEVIMRLKAAE